MTDRQTLRIAVLPGDGIGGEIMPGWLKRGARPVDWRRLWRRLLQGGEPAPCEVGGTDGTQQVFEAVRTCLTA